MVRASGVAVVVQFQRPVVEGQPPTANFTRGFVMRLLDASWTQLQEIALEGDRELAELLISEIIAVEVRRQVTAHVDRELRRRAFAPADPWLPSRR